MANWQIESDAIGHQKNRFFTLNIFFIFMADFYDLYETSTPYSFDPLVVHTGMACVPIRFFLW
jgi:hypothetical protein